MNEMQVFSSPEFGKVRTLEEDGKVLFCGTDIARALGYSIPRKAVREHCKGGLKRTGVSYTTNQHGKTSAQECEMTYIPEGDVYRLIVRSKLPTAEKFERWVFDEVLPNIRKTGSYGQMDVMQIIQQTAAAMMSEFVKQVMPLFTATEPVRENRWTEPLGVCKLESFPTALRDNVDGMLEEMLDEQQLNYSKIARYCTIHGYPISSPAVKTYFKRRFMPI